ISLQLGAVAVRPVGGGSVVVVDEPALVVVVVVGGLVVVVVVVARSVVVVTVAGLVVVVVVCGGRRVVVVESPGGTTVRVKFPGAPAKPSTTMKYVRPAVTVGVMREARDRPVELVQASSLHPDATSVPLAHVPLRR